jgi:hypothetical protein
VQKKCKEILKLYSDKDGEKKAEVEVLAGQRSVNWRTESGVSVGIEV